jgi:hypothetical protein
MLKRFCNRCDKDLKNKNYYEIEINKWGKYGNQIQNEVEECFPKLYDLCEDCYKQLLKFLGESN